MHDFSKEILEQGVILKNLNTLDYYCKEENVSADLVMLDGSALLTLIELNGGIFRPTMDVDINIINVSDRKVFTEQLKKVNIEIVGGIMEVPPLEDLDDQNSHFEIEVGFEAIRVFLPNLELLACSKIFSTRGKDLSDLENTSILEYCNKDRLMSMVEEYKQYLLNPSNLNLNVHHLNRIFE